MSSRPRLSVTQTQRLNLTPGLQSSIALLRADAAGLTRYLEEQAAVNPHLALDPPPAPSPGDWLPRWSGVIGTGLNSTGLNSTGPNSTGPNSADLNSTGVFGTGMNGTGVFGTGMNGTGVFGVGVNGTGMNGTGMNDTGMNGIGMNDTGMNDTGMNDTGMTGTGMTGTGMTGVAPAEASGDGQTAAPPASLMAHVLAEAARLVETPENRRIAYALAEALEPSGWLGSPLTAIAADLGAPLAAVEAVLKTLQKMDPAGLFARNLAECLTLQLAEAGRMDAVMEVIVRHLELLAAGDLPRLARLARTGTAEIEARFRLIRSLDPKPGSQFAALAAPPAREPDLLVRRAPDGAWDCALNRSALPSLRIVEPGRDAVAQDVQALIAARALSRMVVSRNETLLRVGREVLSRQRAALDHGAQALLPLTMADVAAALDLHESTVSRVVAGVSVDTPRGTFWLRRFFSSRLGADGGPQASGAALQARLQGLIARENPAAPLSDLALSALMSQDGPALARRTVAKYRTGLGIAPAHRRRTRGLSGKPPAGV